MSGTDAATIATTCLRASVSGDSATARALLRDDVTFVGPFGATRGVDEFLGGLEDLAEIVRGIEERKVIVDGDDVCIMYDLVTVPEGSLPASCWYHVDDGKIDSASAYFDTRRLGRRDLKATSDDPARPGARVGGTTPAPVLPVFCSAEMEIAEWDDSP